MYQARLKETGEIVEVVCSLYGTVTVLYINRPKVKIKGKFHPVRARLRLHEIEFISERRNA